LQLPGGLYHITARGNRRQRVFSKDRDHERFLELLEHVSTRLAWRCHGYCLMPNHYHLVLETLKPNLSVGMHRLNSGYAHWFNTKYGLEGHLFQSRFHAVLIESDWHFVELSRYLAMNPVRAGLCSTPSAWEWSSYRFVVDHPTRPPFLDVDRVLGHFGRHPQKAGEAFRAFVLDGGRAGHGLVPGTTPWPV
jgi:REP-associated tyrosine transposase